MAQSRITFGEWLPDQPGLIGALTAAQNVYPKAVGYGPVSEEVDYSDAAGQDLNNIASAFDSNGTVKLFAGGSTKLFLFNSADKSLDDVSATTYSTVSRWRFTQFGNSLIAASSANTMQRYDLTTTGNFQVLDTGAPKAAYVTVVRDFVVTGYQQNYKNRVQWSGIDDPTTWSSSAVTQSDFQDLPDGGDVRGVTGGEFGIVLLERSIYRMSYIGTPFIFQFDNISRNLGCYEANSVVQYQGITYFLADDGFYACDGQGIVPIGAEKVNRFFFANVDEGVIERMSAAVDPFRNLVVWGYPSISDTYRLLFYHVPTKRWSYADTAVNRIANTATPGASLEDLDIFSASIDALGFSLDDRQWLGGKMVFGGVSGQKVITFGGANKAARIDTQDISQDQNTTMITLAKPLIDNGSASIGVASRLTLNQDISYSTAVAASSENRVGLRSIGKYHRLRVFPSGNNWQTAVAVDVETQPAGNR
jgi:hypothetical protein